MSPQKFADKYLLAIEQAAKEKPQGGLNGFEQEWNLNRSRRRPRRRGRRLEHNPITRSSCQNHKSLLRFRDLLNME